MRKTLAAIVLFALLTLAWTAWPLFALYDLSRAVRTADAAAMERRVDFPALRRSLGVQLGQTYARLTGQRPDGLIVATAGSVVDPLVARLIAPDVLTDLLRHGWPKTLIAAPPPVIDAPNLQTLGDVWRLYIASDYGIGRFRLGLPLSATAERQYRLHLDLRNWRWRLAGLDLPRDLQERLARELIPGQRPQ
jgi:hypothetical protein